jgi:hypothetical protein
MTQPPAGIRCAVADDLDGILRADHVAAQGDPERAEFLRSSLMLGQCQVYVADGAVTGFVIVKPAPFFGRDFIEVLLVDPALRWPLHTWEPVIYSGGRQPDTASGGKDPQAAGADAADRVIRAQAAAGVSTERIIAHSQDTAAWLFSEAREPDGEAFARGYDDTAQAMVAELQEEARPAPDRSPGAPHPDPRLAARGWQACEHGDGVYVRRAAVGQRNAGMEREAG